MQKFEIEGLFDFLNKGVSAFHSTAAAVEILEANGYENRPETAALGAGARRQILHHPQRLCRCAAAYRADSPSSPSGGR